MGRIIFDVFVINESETADIILKAQSAAKEIIKPGVKMSIIDKAARDIINKACYEKYYIYIPGYDYVLRTKSLSASSGLTN